MGRFPTVEEEPRDGSAGGRLPLCAAIWNQTYMDKPIRFLDRDEWTRPGKGYIVGRMKKGDPIVALAGPFWSDVQMESALISMEVQPTMSDAGRKRGRKCAHTEKYGEHTEAARLVATAGNGAEASEAA